MAALARVEIGRERPVGVVHFCPRERERQPRVGREARRLAAAQLLARLPGIAVAVTVATGSALAIGMGFTSAIALP